MRQDTPITANGDAVLQIAIQMEELGRDYYEALSELLRDPDAVALCRRLTADEANHRAVFRRLRSELAERGETVLLADEDIAQARENLKHAVVPDRAEILRVASNGGVRDLLEIAIEMERNSVSYYRNLAERIRRTDPVQAVIREEEHHLRALIALAERR